MKQKLCVALMLTAYSSAFAATQLAYLNTRVSDIQLTVTDLTPGDASVASAIPYVSDLPELRPTTRTMVSEWNFAQEPNSNEETHVGMVFDSFEAARTLGGQSFTKEGANFTLTSRLDLDTAGGVLGTFQVGSKLPQFFEGQASIFSGWLELAIAPHTAVTLSADVLMQGQVDLSSLIGASEWKPFLDAQYELFLTADTYLNMTHTDFGGYDGEHYSSVYHANSAETLIGAGGVLGENGSFNTSDLVQLTFNNNTDAEVIRHFYIGASTSFNLEAVAPMIEVPIGGGGGGGGGVPAIPEPSTYALMALGLAGIGAVARRSRPATQA